IGLSPLTVIVSDSEPSLSTIFRSVVPPTATIKPSSLYVLNPDSVASREKVPGRSWVNLYSPCSLVAWVSVRPGSAVGDVSVTVVPGNPAPDSSRPDPMMLPVSTCASAAAVSASMQARSNRIEHLIEPPPSPSGPVGFLLREDPPQRTPSAAGSPLAG